MLRRKKLPSLVDCFATEDIERGSSVRPSCRFEIFKQYVDVDVSVEGEHTNKIDVKVQNDSGRGTVENKLKKTSDNLVLDADGQLTLRQVMVTKEIKELRTGWLP